MPLSNLNEEQFLAATTTAKKNLVIASAGTGKTSTIVGRIAHLLKSGTSPDRILLLTFTNKASNEMITRVAKYFGKDVANKILAGTFHSVSYKLLKNLYDEILLKQPSELKTLLKSIQEKYDFTIDNDVKPYDGSYLYDLYSLYVNTAKDNESFMDWIGSKNPDHYIYLPTYQEIICEFINTKERFNYVNYDDLLILMIKKIKSSNLIFEEILVDEYQDTNPLQNRLLESFYTNSLFCVGDYDQSIYGFNGSDISIISTFTKRYKGSKVFTLSKNYRSTKPILDLANKVISLNPRVYEKKLEVVRKDYSHKPQLLIFDELYEQYSFIAQKIAKSLTPKDDIAVIFRNNSSADGIEANLKEFGIDCKRKGGISFFDSKEIKLSIDILTIFENRNDLMSFINIFEYGKNIGKALAKELFSKILAIGENDIIKGFIEPNLDIDIFKKTQDYIQLSLFGENSVGNITKYKNLGFEEKFLQNPILKHPKLTIDSGSFLYLFYQFIKSVKNIKNPHYFLDKLFKSELFDYIKNYIATNRAKQKDGKINQFQKDEAIIKIDKKCQTLMQLSKKHHTIKNFLNTIILAGNEASNKQGVNLLTVHASKGLEFSEVYIVDLAQGRFPNIKLVSKGGSIEEERRLFYVAVTRAKDKLYLSYAKRDKIRKIDFKPSQFLYEAKLIRDDLDLH